MLLAVHLAFQHSNLDYRVAPLRFVVGAAEVRTHADSRRKPFRLSFQGTTIGPPAWRCHAEPVIMEHMDATACREGEESHPPNGGDDQLPRDEGSQQVREGFGAFEGGATAPHRDSIRSEEREESSPRTPGVAGGGTG